jgi:hypothetical protein
MYLSTIAGLLFLPVAFFTASLCSIGTFYILNVAKSKNPIHPFKTFSDSCISFFKTGVLIATAKHFSDLYQTNN